MKVDNKKICVILVLVLVIIESCTLFLMYKSYSAKETKLDEVNLNIKEKDNMFAIMLEQSDGTYKESSDNSWPTDGYTYNASMSGCIDINGNKLDGVLSYDATNNIATVDTGKTSYCYLYFSLPKWCNEDETASECLLRNPTSGLNTSIEAGMYRYQGTDAMNYVCFGTTVKSECVGNTDAYMYRIIGIQENGQMKLIKKEALNTAVHWWDDMSDIEWPGSLIYTTINGNDFLLNETYVPTGWESKIVAHNWKYGDTTSSGNFDGPTIYAVENGWINTVSAKVGLMYIHDYYYAYASGGAPGSKSNAKTAWIYLGANDSSSLSTTKAGPPSFGEWFMSRYGIDYVWYVHSDGDVSNYYFDYGLSVRPVFYLTSDVEIIGGTGTIDDPFLIS